MNFVYLPGIFLLISCSESMAVFMVSPSSYNASEGSNVTFHCHINESGNILFWLVNDEFSHSSANQNRSISLIKYSNERSILTIQALSWNDHVEIQCAYRSKQSRSVNCSNEMVMCSAKAVLRVQGLLPQPTNFNGQPLPNDLTIFLTWEAPLSLDLTDIDPDITHYEISVFDNKTGASENFTTFHTEYTYLVHHIHSTDLCQDLEFSVLALNVVGKGSKSTLKIAPREAPHVKLVDTETAMQENNAKIECTTTCNSLLTWRLHTHNLTNDINVQNWYEVVATNQSEHLCTETIALTSLWFAQPVNVVSVQCIAVSICPREAQTACLHSVCLSNIQDVFIGEPGDVITDEEVKKAIDKTIIGLICGSSVLLTALCLMVIVLAILIARAGIIRRQPRRCVNIRTETTFNREERIYESPAELTADQVDRPNINLELNDKNPGSLYSLPLPTDPCPAYDTFMKKQ